MSDFNNNSYQTPLRQTLKSQVDSDPLPPAPSSAQRRIADLNITGYPHPLNTHLLPARAQQEMEWADPLKRANPYAPQGDTLHGNRETAVVPMMTTKQLAAQMTQLGMEMQAHPERLSYQSAPRGYTAKHYPAPFDERTVYRLDYSQDQIPPLSQRTFTESLSRHRDGWTEEERRNIDASMRKPYLTQPDSCLTDARSRTMYRTSYNANRALNSGSGEGTYYLDEEDPNQYRLLSHKTDLRELGTTFGFSGYRGDSDPRRQVQHDHTITSLPNAPRSVLDKSYSPRKNFEDSRRRFGDTLGGSVGPSYPGAGLGGTGKTFASISTYVRNAYEDEQRNGSGGGGDRGSRAHQELQEMRALRRASLERSLAAREDFRGKRLSAEQIADGASSPLVMPGAKGTGARRAPTTRKEDYIYLPQDHFTHRSINDY